SYIILPPPPSSPLFPYTTLFRSSEELQPMINAFFAPIFFVSIGLEINARHVGNGVGFFFLLLLIAIVGKIFGCGVGAEKRNRLRDRKSTRLNSSHSQISYAVFCL